MAAGRRPCRMPCAPPRDLATIRRGTCRRGNGRSTRSTRTVWIGRRCSVGRARSGLVVRRLRLPLRDGVSESEVWNIMFAYVNPSVKEELVREHKLWCIDERGAECPRGTAEAAPFISLVGPVPLPIRMSDGHAMFQWYAAARHSDLERIEQVVGVVREQGPKGLFALLADYIAVNSVLVYGEFEKADAPLVRVHSNCLTGDVFGSMRCECGPQLRAAQESIVREGVGAIVYMAGHEGRGIGLWAKAVTYLLQDAGHDTYQANERLGLPTDSRDFGDAGRLLLHLRHGKKRIRLLGNNPSKRKVLEQMGLEVVEQRPLVVGVNPFNSRYLTSKREHGHLIPDLFG